jgi:hypothetical protein
VDIVERGGQSVTLVVWVEDTPRPTQSVTVQRHPLFIFQTRPDELINFVRVSEWVSEWVSECIQHSMFNCLT